VYFDDYTQITFSANKLTYTPTARLKPYNWYAILLDGGVEDYYRNPTKGIGLFTRFRTGPAKLQPSAWRVSASTETRFNDNPSWMPIEANLTNASFTRAGEGWRVTELEFYNSGTCGGSRLFGTPISSGNTGLSTAYKAFDADINTYWDYDLDVSDSEYAPKNLLSTLYNNETHAIETEDEILLCNNVYNNVRRCDQPGNYWLGLYLGRNSGDNVWSFRIAPTDVDHTPMNISLEYYHDKQWWRLRLFEANLTDTQHCYEVGLNYSTSDWLASMGKNTEGLLDANGDVAPAGDSLIDAQGPQLISSMPDVSVEAETAAVNILQKRQTLSWTFDEDVRFNET
jgi:hypothetical protein